MCAYKLGDVQTPRIVSEAATGAKFGCEEVSPNVQKNLFVLKVLMLKLVSPYQNSPPSPRLPGRRGDMSPVSPNPV